VDRIHEEGDFADGKPVLLLLWYLELRSFIRRAAVCRTEDRSCSVDKRRSRTQRSRIPSDGKSHLSFS